jgi:flagellar basal-body rod modification protein FlgD
MSVMSVKQGTRTWSPAEQASSLKGDNAQSLGAPDRDKALGGQNLGEVLNKVADANYVDPAKTRKVGNNQLDKDAFLKLMLAQMKHQDPTNPMQSHEMAAQLAQFTSLEQLNNINTTLEGMKQSQAPAVGYQALNFIGKRVAGDSSRLARVAGDTNHDVNFQLLGDAAKVRVTLKDADGNTVRKLELPGMKKGENSIRWNGLSEEGVAARPGEYRVAIEAFSATGGKVFAKTEFDGKITGINYTGQGPVLMVGTQTIRLQDVKKIVEDDAKGGTSGPGAGGPLSAAGAAAPLASGAPAASASAAPGPSPAAGALAPSAGSGAPAPGATEQAMAIASAKDAAAATALAMAGGKAGAPAPAIEAANAQASVAAGRAAYPASAASQLAENVPPAEEPPPAQGNILDTVAMSREVMNKITNPKQGE